MAAVEHTVARIVENPEAGAPVAGGIRRRLVPDFPFALGYRVLKDEIRVLAVMHLRRRPGYWRTRR